MGKNIRFFKSPIIFIKKKIPKLCIKVILNYIITELFDINFFL